MAVFPNSIHSAQLQFQAREGYRGPSHWRVRVEVQDPRVNDLFVVAPFTVDPWKSQVSFDASSPNRVPLQRVGEQHGRAIFEGTVTTRDTNAMDMAKRVVVGFNGGLDWAQGFGDSIGLSMVYGRND